MSRRWEMVWGDSVVTCVTWLVWLELCELYELWFVPGKRQASPDSLNLLLKAGHFFPYSLPLSLWVQVSLWRLVSGGSVSLTMSPLVHFLPPILSFGSLFDAVYLTLGSLTHVSHFASVLVLLSCVALRLGVTAAASTLEVIFFLFPFTPFFSSSSFHLCVIGRSRRMNFHELQDELTFSLSFSLFLLFSLPSLLTLRAK